MRHYITLCGAILIVCFFIIFTKSEANQYVPTLSNQKTIKKPLSTSSDEYLRKEIRNTLKNAGIYTDSLYKLLLGTAATESDYGQYTKQINGTALGIFQIEPNTQKDIWKNYLSVNEKMKTKVKAVLWKHVGLNMQLRYNLKYQILIAAINYKRSADNYNQHLPKSTNVMALAKAYKKYHNTDKGKGSTDRFCKKYKEYVASR